jgi:rubrerythrin
LLLQAEDNESRKIFEYLVNQEKEHLAVLDELALLLNKSNDWVEAAEFGVREEE